MQIMKNNSSLRLMPRLSKLSSSLSVCLLIFSSGLVAQAQAPATMPAPMPAPAPRKDLAADAAAAKPPSNKPAVNALVRKGNAVTLNFADAEIAAVARTIAVITGRNVVVDPQVQGTMTLVTTTPVLPAQALRQFAAQLRTQGYALVESSGLYLVVPLGDAKLQSGTVSTQVPRPSSASGQLVTQIFRLNYENAASLVPILRPLIRPDNTINVNAATNSLIITDYTDNIERLATIIAALDVSNATGVEIIPLKHASATDLAPLVMRLIGTSSSRGAAPGDGAPDSAPVESGVGTTVLAEPRSNTLILRAANPARVALVRTLVHKLDQEAYGKYEGDGSGNIYVVYLKNADATKLAITLRAALGANAGAGGVSGFSGGAGASGMSGSVGSGQISGAAAASPGSGSLSSNQPSTGGQIQADPATNSLIITAPEPQYRQLRAVIDKLDSRRAQVFVESLIVEVNADKAAEFGIQFQGPLGRKGDGSIGLLGTNFGIGGTNIISLAKNGASLEANATLPAKGLNFGVATQSNGVYMLGFLARFLEANGDGNILSTPTLLTLDNEEARIVIGQNVPFVTGQYTNNNSNAGSVNPFQTVERKDVGITLRVKPQISESGTIKMQIFQEVSSVQASSINSSTGLITNKRSIESNVLVEDGAIVVLGGLLQDEYSGNQEKVPLLGDVPLFGNLFKSETRSRKKTNLMVFLRPVVVRDAAATQALSVDRYELMRGAQTAAQPPASVVVPINEAPVLPPVKLRLSPGLPSSPAQALPSATLSAPPAPSLPESAQ